MSHSSEPPLVDGGGDSPGAKPSSGARADESGGGTPGDTPAVRVAGRIGALLMGERPERSAAFEELAAIANGSGPASGPDPIAVATACIAPLVQSVLCADASRVDATEVRQANLLLSSLMLLDPLTVGVEYLREERWCAAWTAPNTALAASIAKQPADLTRDDVILAASDMVPAWIVWSKGPASSLQHRWSRSRAWPT